MSTLTQPTVSQTGAARTQRVEDALSLIAPKWTTWVVQTLAQHHEPMRVRDVADRLPFVNVQFVGKRLAQMHADGLVARSAGPHGLYRLSGPGTSLIPVHQALADWSYDHFSFTPGTMAGAERVEDALRRLHLRHTTAVIQALDAGPMRFVHLAEAVSLDDPTTRKRLVRLDADGLVTRTGPRHGDPYTLTTAGRALRPVYAAIEHWSTTAPQPGARATTATRIRQATPSGPDGIRTAAALRRSPAAPSGGLFSHAPTPHPPVPTATGRSAPAPRR